MASAWEANQCIEITIDSVELSLVVAIATATTVVLTDVAGRWYALDGQALRVTPAKTQLEYVQDGEETVLDGRVSARVRSTGVWHAVGTPFLDGVGGAMQAGRFPVLRLTVSTGRSAYPGRDLVFVAARSESPTAYLLWADDPRYGFKYWTTSTGELGLYPDPVDITITSVGGRKLAVQGFGYGAWQVDTVFTHQLADRARGAASAAALSDALRFAMLGYSGLRLMFNGTPVRGIFFPEMPSAGLPFRDPFIFGFRLRTREGAGLSYYGDPVAGYRGDPIVPLPEKDRFAMLLEWNTTVQFVQILIEAETEYIRPVAISLRRMDDLLGHAAMGATLIMVQLPTTQSFLNENDAPVQFHVVFQPDSGRAGFALQSSTSGKYLGPGLQLVDTVKYAMFSDEQLTHLSFVGGGEALIDRLVPSVLYAPSAALCTGEAGEPEYCPEAMVRSCLRLPHEPMCACIAARDIAAEAGVVVPGVRRRDYHCLVDCGNAYKTPEMRVCPAASGLGIDAGSAAIGLGLITVIGVGVWVSRRLRRAAADVPIRLVTSVP